MFNNPWTKTKTPQTNEQNKRNNLMIISLLVKYVHIGAYLPTKLA